MDFSARMLASKAAGKTCAVGLIQMQPAAFAANMSPMDPAQRVLVKVNQDRGDRRVQTVCLLVLTVIAVGVALFLLRPVLVPFILALLFTYCLTPLIELQVRRFGIPRGT